MNNMVDATIEYIDSLSVDELEELFKSYGIDVVKKPDVNQVDTPQVGIA
jgi:hypothetical protein